MACFLVPMTEAIVTTVAKKVIEKKEQKAGAEKVIVVPLFIATGVHLCEEIAEKLRIPSYSDGGEAEVCGKKVSIVYCQPMGDEPRLVDIIDRKAAEFLGE